jgi:hypothetical protein
MAVTMKISVFQDVVHVAWYLSIATWHHIKEDSDPHTLNEFFMVSLSVSN